MKSPGRSSKDKDEAKELSSLKGGVSRAGAHSLRFRYELRPKNKTITLRVSGALLAAIKERAEQSGIDYQKFIRLVLEQAVERKQ